MQVLNNTKNMVGIVHATPERTSGLHTCYTSANFPQCTWQVYFLWLIRTAPQIPSSCASPATK